MEPRQEVERQIRPKEPRHCQNSKPGPKTQRREKPSSPVLKVKRHPRRPRGGQSGREKRRHQSFQAQAEKPMGTNSHRTISKRSSECWPLIGHKKCFLLLCPIGEQFLLSSRDGSLSTSNATRALDNLSGYHGRAGRKTYEMTAEKARNEQHT